MTSKTAAPARTPELEEQIAVAIELARPGNLVSPTEVQQIFAAAEQLEAAGGATSKGEERLLRAAEKLRFYGPRPDPAPPDDPEILERIAAAAGVVEARKTAHDEAFDALVLLQAKQMRANGSEARQYDQALLRAKRAYDAACEALNHAQSNLCDVQQERAVRHQAWRIEQSIAAQRAAKEKPSAMRRALETLTGR